MSKKHVRSPNSGIQVKYPKNPTDEQRTKAFTNAYKKFNKFVKRENILNDYRDAQVYEKPSEIKRRNKAAAKKRWAKKRKELIQERGW